MAFEIVWESLGVRKRFWGFVTIPELVESVVKPLGDSRFERIRYVIHDFLDVEEHDITEAAIAGIAAISGAGQSVNPNINIAILTTCDKIKNLAWLYSSRILATYPVRIFSSRDEANEWLESAPPRKAPGPFVRGTHAFMEVAKPESYERTPAAPTPNSSEI